jgi:hypothetical protein
MTRFVAYIALAPALGLVACHPKDEPGSEFAAGVPRSSTVAMAVPGSDAKALTVEGRQLRPRWDKLPNGTPPRAPSPVSSTAPRCAVGALVRMVTDYPATSVTPDSAVWGPWQGPLDPVEWKVTVTRTWPPSVRLQVRRP